MPGQRSHTKRRFGIGAFHIRYFVGAGLDVGSGHDPLTRNASAFRLIHSLAIWDRPQGDAQFLATVPDNTFDFLHASQILEHLVDPKVGLFNWIRVVKPGGYLIITVPDEDLYERGSWPSKFNPDHKWSFTIYKKESWNNGRSLNVLDLCLHFGDVVEVEKIELIRDFFHENWPPHIDQTAATITVESSIEMILRKRVIEQALESRREERSNGVSTSEGQIRR
jgi:SAM-dependent methyltransferase